MTKFAQLKYYKTFDMQYKLGNYNEPFKKQEFPEGTRCSIAREPGALLRVLVGIVH